jgi:hypothetical protein
MVFAIHPLDRLISEEHFENGASLTAFGLPVYEVPGLTEVRAL